jgi:hypothetical protein
VVCHNDTVGVYKEKLVGGVTAMRRVVIWVCPVDFRLLGSKVIRYANI